MEKDKLSKIKNFGKKALLPLAATFMLHNAIAAPIPTATKKTVSKEFINTQTEKNYLKYRADESIKNLQVISNSEYKNMSEYKYLEKDVLKNVTSMLNDLNTHTLQLTRSFDSYEIYYINNKVVPLLINYKIVNNNADSKQVNNAINKIIENDFKDANGKDLPADLIVAVINTIAQNYVQKAHDSFILISSGADETQIIKNVDHGDNHNEVYENFIKVEQAKVFDKNGNEAKDRDLLTESRDFLKNIEDVVINGYCRFAFDQGKFYTSKTVDNRLIAENLGKIKNLVSVKGKNVNEKELNKLINATANMLPEEMFGTYEMRRGWLAEFASRHASNELLANLENLNYNVKSPKKFTFGIDTGYKLTNKEQGATLGVNANWKTDKLGVSAGLNSAVLAEKTDETTIHTLQVSANAGLSKTFNNRHTVEGNVLFGFETNMLEFNPLLGSTIAYLYEINDQFSIGGKTSYLTDFKSQDITAGIIGKFMFDNVVTSFSFEGGANIPFGKEIKNPEPDPIPEPGPDKPTPPITGGDDIKPGNPDDEEEQDPSQRGPKQDSDKPTSPIPSDEQEIIQDNPDNEEVQDPSQRLPKPDYNIIYTK